MIRGYEKAWNALLNGGFATTASTLALYVASRFGTVTAPDEAAITAAITGGIASLAAAIGAYMATTSPTTPPAAAPVTRPE